MRKKYKPATVKVLFVAESPPFSSDDRFFYNRDQESRDYLYRSVMEAVFPNFKFKENGRGRKDEWLRKFMEHGYYMIDATDSPVNQLTPAKRRSMIEGSVATKLSEIAALVCKNTPILLVKKNVFEAFKEPLRCAGFNVINTSFLPFPSHGHQDRFIKDCRSYLKSALKSLKTA